jgi:nucleoside-diphosphate-sugar epimerase
MKVLVTGVTGFTGGHLARTLLRAGDTVRVLARDPRRVPADLQGALEIVEGDLTRRADLDRAVAGCEVVYNIAALYREAGLPAEAYRSVNALSVVSLIEAAAATGARRVVHCSTVGVHGDVEHPPADEDAPLRPGDIYQETKVEGERLAREAAERVGIELVIARPTGIYGPGDRRLFKMFGQIARGRFVMLGSGRNFYHLTYVDDLCDGFRLCGTVPGVGGRTYILGGGEVTTLATLVRITGEIAGRTRGPIRLPVWPVWLAGALCEIICAPLRLAPPIYRRRVDFFRKSRSFDIGRARRELGYAPRVGVREGIGRTLEWYREHGWI